MTEPKFTLTCSDDYREVLFVIHAKRIIVRFQPLDALALAAGLASFALQITPRRWIIRARLWWDG